MKTLQADKLQVKIFETREEIEEGTEKLTKIEKVSETEKVESEAKEENSEIKVEIILPFHFRLIYSLE